MRARGPASAKDLAAGVCSFGLIVSLALNYVEVGLDPDGWWWTALRLLFLAVFVVSGLSWLVLWRREQRRS